MLTNKFSNLEILCFILGWQGGTIYQVAEKLEVTPIQILNASEDRLKKLVRIAQHKRSKYIDVILPREIS